jgi:hypothetical protein
MEDILVPALLHELGNNHNDLTSWIVFGELEDKLHDGDDHKPVRGGEKL